MIGHDPEFAPPFRTAGPVLGGTGNMAPGGFTGRFPTSRATQDAEMEFGVYLGV